MRGPTVVKEIIMKLRIGFISNSSTCSFLIYGIVEERPEIIDILIKHNILPSNIEDEDEYLIDGKGGKKLREQGLVFDTVYDGEFVTIGRSWGSIRDDETGKQFKESIEAGIKALCGDEYKCETQEGAYQC